MTYFGEGFAWGPGVGGILFRLALKQIFSKKIFKYFPYTLRVPSTD